LGRHPGGYPSGRRDHVKEDVMYMSIGTVLAIVLIIVLLAWIL
jgi:hypothetical protein